jgi:ATP-dependent HslUV protease, peptidase subunit HslV
LMELLEKEFEKYPGQTLRSCLSLAKQWRTNKMHQQLSADLLVSDAEITVLVDGSGNCIEIEDGLVAIGSGGLYAQSAAKAMLDNDYLTAEDIARRAMHIAGDLCVYTNHTTVMEILTKPQKSTVTLNTPSLAVRQLLTFLGQSCNVTEDESDPYERLEDGPVILSDNKAILRYLSRKFYPKLLGRSAAEHGICSMISSVHNSEPIIKVVELLEQKDFICGADPTYLDFCVFETLQRPENKNIVDSVLIKSYLERVRTLRLTVSQASKQQSFLL